MLNPYKAKKVINPYLANDLSLSKLLTKYFRYSVPYKFSFAEIRDWYALINPG